MTCRCHSGEKLVLATGDYDCRGRGGLTIIEVLIALAIFAIVTAATVPVLITTMRSNSDNRVRAQAVAAADVWLDRFRAKSLNFSHFSGLVSYPFEYDYGADPIFVAAADPDPEALNREWQSYKFDVNTSTFSTDPLVWRVELRTYYRTSNGSEANFDVATLIEQ